MNDGNGEAGPAEGFVADENGTRWTYVGTLTFANAAAVCMAAGSLSLPTGGVVDLSGLATVDSAAVAVLLSIKRRAAEEGAPLVFDHVPALLDALATVYGVEDILVSHELFASS